MFVCCVVLVTKKLLLPSSTIFSSSVFLLQVSWLEFRLSFLFVFCFTSESSCFRKFCSWQTKILKLVNSSERRSISERNDIELLSLNGIICSSPGKTLMLSNWVFLILLVTSLNESFSLLTTFRKTHWHKTSLFRQFLCCPTGNFLHKNASCCPGIVLIFLIVTPWLLEGASSL